MSQELLVVLENRVAGTLTRLSGGRLRLDYHEEYRAAGTTTPLSVSMPTEIASHRDRTVNPWLWGLLPDNEGVLRRWARRFQASAASPFSMLGTPIGHDCPGAVRFAPPQKIDELLDRPGQVAWLNEDEVADRLRELKRDSTAWLGRDFTGQFSLAGTQAKTALLHEEGRWGVPSGAAATSHILKPAVAGLDDHDLNEHLCMDAARRAGLVVARTQITRFGEESAIVVERYDRRVLNGRLVRVHQEDICQALGVSPSTKYQREGGPGAEDVARLMSQVMPPRTADEAIWRFADALAWNWLIAGTDAHAKNYSLLLSGKDVRLAPLYDVASALPYDEHERKLRLAMKIGGDYRVHPYRNPWPAAAAELQLDAGALIDRVRWLADRTPDALRDAAAAPAVAKLQRPLPSRLVDRVAERVLRCRKMLEASAPQASRSPTLHRR